ncbi:uncharacterized protein BDCG_05307 [Blastomyces dermatitidis ER-3]|uniref:Uncharacterized protein n=1 Tax=Ajellomyces dermatitidis (strain ER-3 / ATCC MYA-2586) TaxID=559297 RepID=A0ABP2F0I4_AJEDR|nr:uncharacterized protein BDCG_05307 [Blastomyces dermatitidis ER-3]EEQ90187.2 hypothetical protein BDCG_05307 [Blastomyces dermatitidis ER-3]
MKLDDYSAKEGEKEKRKSCLAKSLTSNRPPTSLEQVEARPTGLDACHDTSSDQRHEVTGVKLKGSSPLPNGSASNCGQLIGFRFHGLKTKWSPGCGLVLAPFLF